MFACGDARLEQRALGSLNAAQHLGERQDAHDAFARLPHLDERPDSQARRLLAQERRDRRVERHALWPIHSGTVQYITI
eukprot:6527338-Prymnesium_polylepis.1